MANVQKKITEPEERAEFLDQQVQKYRRKYRVATTKPRRYDIPSEEELVKEMVVILRLAGYTINQIAAIAGCSQRQVSNYFEEKRVQNRYLYLRERLPMAAIELGKQYLIEAVATIVHIMRTEKDSALVLRAAAEIMDRFGLAKTSKSEKVVTENEGNEFSHAENTILDQIRKLSPETQEKAAQLHELFITGMRQLVSEAKKEEDEVSSD